MEIAKNSQLTDIKGSAFRYCENLALFIIQCTTPPKLDDRAFSNTPTSTCILQVPAGYKGIYEQSSYWKDFDNIVEL